MVYNENDVCDGKYDAVSDICAGKENVRIKVRVIRLWKVPAFINPSEYSSIEMILVDNKGGKIHATIRKQLIYMFESKIEEGMVYEMSSFTIFPENGCYRPTLHPQKLLFQVKTRVTLCDGSSDITEYGLDVTDIAEVTANTHDYDYLVDVIGFMTGKSAEREYVRDGKLTKMVVIELTDHSGKVECALFGDYVDQLNNKMGKTVGGLPIVVVQFAKIKIFRDKASLQNVMNTTRILVNPDIPEVDKFKDSVAVHGVELDATVPLIGEPKKPSFEEEFLRMHPKKTIAELENLVDGGLFTVCAEVVGVTDGGNWWYPACKCHKGVVPDSGSYFCSACDRHVFQVVPRFRVKLEVTDGKTSGVFVMFDSEMSYIMEKSCAYFVAKAKAANSAPYPVEFDSLIGRRYLFVIERPSKQTTVSDSSYRVKRVCMDPKVIDLYCVAGPYLIPSQVLGQPINVDSDAGSEGYGTGEDSEPVEFLKDLIVTPNKVDENVEVKCDGGGRVKRNLCKSFEASAKPKVSRRYKQVKIEKE